MIYSATDTLIDYLEEYFEPEPPEDPELEAEPAWLKVHYYNGEFEPETDWNPLFPAVFVSLESVMPNQIATGLTASFQQTINVYCGIKFSDTNQKHFFDFLVTAINTINDEQEANGFTSEISSIVLYGFVKGVQVYKITVMVNVF